MTFLTKELSSTGDLEEIAKRYKEQRLHFVFNSFKPANRNEEEGSALYDWRFPTATPKLQSIESGLDWSSNNRAVVTE